MDALIALRLAFNRERGAFCGGLIASHLLAMHGLAPHYLDVQLPIERLDFNSMMKHNFIPNWAALNNLSYELSFVKKSGWRVVKSDHIVGMPAPLLFNLDRRESWSFLEDELDAYMESHGQSAEDDGEWAGDDFAKHSDTGGFQPQHLEYDGPSASSSSADPYYDHARDDPPAWASHPRWGGIPISHTNLYIIFRRYFVHPCFVFFLSFCSFLLCCCFSKHKKT